ncbi:hypothetical protein ACW18Z_05045 [Limosilactobacillus fermentum]
MTYPSLLFNDDRRDFGLHGPFEFKQLLQSTPKTSAALVSGMILLPAPFANAITAFAGKLYDQYGPKWLIATGGC